MKVGLYFGSFNPIHTGHCIIANHILSHSGLNQVWFVVSPQNPFKVSSGLLNEYHRLHLVRTAIGDEAGLKASDVEFNLPKPSYTIDTLAHLDARYPEYEFSVIMGSDSYQNFHKWKNAEMIVRHYSLIVYQRPGYPIEGTVPANVTILEAPLLQISATHIRETIRAHRSIRYLVPDQVKEEIERNGYYR